MNIFKCAEILPNYIIPFASLYDWYTYGPFWLKIMSKQCGIWVFIVCSLVQLIYHFLLLKISKITGWNHEQKLVVCSCDSHLWFFSGRKNLGLCCSCEGNVKCVVYLGLNQVHTCRSRLPLKTPVLSREGAK